MGQGDIIILLSKNKEKWFTTRAIANGLNVGISCTLVKLRKLRAREELIFKRESNIYYYKYKPKREG